MQHQEFDVQNGAEQRLRRVEQYRDGPKRALDIIGVLILAPIAVPIVAALWGLARIDGGSGFFGHKRVGKDGREFTCWKIRTMVPDASIRLQSHLIMYPHAAKEWEQFYKLSNDPRVTWCGRFLRRSSLDELPQLWNVLRGEMSLVGPRPVPRHEFSEYFGFEWAYVTMRPGITGVWQVSGRHGVSYRERIRMDVGYVLRASLGGDLRLLWQTIGAVLLRTGQ